MGCGRSSTLGCTRCGSGGYRGGSAIPCTSLPPALSQYYVANGLEVERETASQTFLGMPVFIYHRLRKGAAVTATDAALTARESASDDTPAGPRRPAIRAALGGQHLKLGPRPRVVGIEGDSREEERIAISQSPAGQGHCGVVVPRGEARRHRPDALRASKRIGEVAARSAGVRLDPLLALAQLSVQLV